jgi:3-oxoacyl-[acyl-carrier protein] reductase
MDLGLGGRTALVLGASSGLGLASAEALREEGANVVMLARREEPLREHADRLGATAVPGDVRERADLLRAVETAVRAHGGLDVLVLNGGGPPAGTAQDTDEDAVRLAVELLLTPVVTLTRAALPHLRACGGI